MPESDVAGDRRAFDATVFDPHASASNDSGAFVERVNAASEEAVRQKLVESNIAASPDDVIEVKPVVERLRVEISGTTDEIESGLKRVRSASRGTTADVRSFDEDAYVRIDDGDDSDADVYGVESWHNVLMRVTGIREGLSGDGMDITADQFASSDSTVEFMVGDEVIAKFVMESSDGES
jgi:hypothetical protein